jgi:hypothetical protein
MNRANLIKEGIYYTLGILLIFGFIYLYWGHFSDAPGPPSAVTYLRTHWAYFCPFVIESSGAQKGCSPLLSWLYLPKCSVFLC